MTHPNANQIKLAEQALASHKSKLATTANKDQVRRQISATQQRLSALRGTDSGGAVPETRTTRGGIHRLGHGDSMLLGTQGGNDAVKVTYHERQSYGDSGARVPGAYTGAYTVEYPNGRTTTHEHGPYAKTEGAARRGASRDSKPLTAERVHSEITSHFATKAMGFNDRRT